MRVNLPLERKSELLKRAKSGESISRICREAGISRTILYRWLNSSKVSTKIKHSKSFKPQIVNKILKVAIENPNLSVHEIAKLSNVSSHGAWKVLKNNNLNTVKKRVGCREEKGTSLIRVVESDIKLKIIKRYETGESISVLCEKFGISRTVFYRWLKRYRTQGKTTDALINQRPEGNRHWRSKPEAKELLLQIIIDQPELSVHKLAKVLTDSTGKKLLGAHGIHNLLVKMNLNHMESRIAYANSYTPTVFIPPVPASLVLPQTPRYTFISHLPPPLRDFVSSYGPLVVSSFLISLFGIIYISTLSSSGSITGALGVTFAWLAIILGMFFFIYSVKYYITIAIVLSFSRNQLNSDSEQQTSNSLKSFWGRLFGVEITVEDPSNKKSYIEKAQLGLQHDLSNIKLDRLPFISIQLSTYNEKRVINRLLTAATSMDYPNYEVIIADDSNDETVTLIEEFVSEWNKSHGQNHLPAARLPAGQGRHGPLIKISRRESRDGYKGGALREALKITDPRAEFILIFDADFIPYPDSITQFLKYFKYTAGTLDFNKVSSSKYKVSSNNETTIAAEQQIPATNYLLPNTSNIAAVQGYQWHVLNKSENWITRGVRSEYAGSYVIERSGAEVYGGLKQISGSVYMIRRDVLQSIGWGTSITEDFELTLRLYEKGWKVVYTPYIQAPAEAVSTLKRLIRQRMRWAEGHSFNIKRMFKRLMIGSWVERGNPAVLENSEFRIQNSESNKDIYNANLLHSKATLNSKLNSELSTLNSKSDKLFIPSPLTFIEKLELLYLTPYYLQAAFFILGTISWLISETVFRVRLPFWTEVWGWSLVLTNLFALPLMNLVGLFMEESEEKDYAGLLSFIVLSYIVAPFQAYAAIKGFLEDREGPWFRTPKTGRITDIFVPGRFVRIFSGLFGRPTASVSAAIAKPVFSDKLNFSLSTRNNLFNSFRIRSKQRRWIGNAFFTFIVVTLMAITIFSPFIPMVSQTSANTFDFGTSTGRENDILKETKQSDIKNKDEIIKNGLSKEINSPRSIIKELKTGGNIEYIFHKEPRVRIKFDGYEIDYKTVKIGNSEIKPEKSTIFKDKEVIYKEVLKGIDIKYTINNGLITEEFIVEDREAADRLGDIKQNLKTSGLNVISTNPESFGFYLPDGKEALKFSDPFARDNKGEIFRNIKMQLKKTGLDFELSKTINQNLFEWMNSSERSYPVSIDPSVVVSGGIADGETQFGSMQRKVASFSRSTGNKIDDAGDPGSMSGSSSQLVRTSGGVLYAVINDGGDLEVWKSTDAVTWTEPDTAGPTDLNSGSEVALATDSSNTIHILYENNSNSQDLRYITYASDAFDGGGSATAVNLGGTGNSFKDIDIALDSYDVPHVIGIQYGNSNRLKYANKVGGSWNADIDSHQGVGMQMASLAISEDDVPEIAFIDSTNDDLVGLVGNANNATSFTDTSPVIDSSVHATAGVYGTDIAIDPEGNTWIAYIDVTTQYVTLAKHADAAAWNTWTTYTNSNVGSEPNIVVENGNVYVGYVDENADVAWDRYNGSWLGETIRRAGTFQDVRMRWSYNNHYFSTSIEYLYSDGTDIYWDSLLDNYYVFYNESGDISYKKSTDGGVQWNTAVTIDDADTDNYNPSIAVSSTAIYVFWVDNGADRIEGRRIDTSSSDTQGTLCQTSVEGGGIDDSFMVSVAGLSTSTAVVAYSDTDSDTEVNAFSLAALGGSCTGNSTSIITGNITFGSGITSLDRPVLVAIDSNTVDVIFQDGNLSYSRFEVTNNEWVRNNLTIASVSHNIYSVVTNGTTIWVLALDTSQNDEVFLYSCCTDDISSVSIDADTGANSQHDDSGIDIFCVSATDCKIVYVDNMDSAGSQDLVFVDCDDATCSSSQSFTIDADLDGDTDGTSINIYPAIFCTSTDDCKVVYMDNYDDAAPDAVFYDCDDADGAGDNIPCDDGATATVTDTDIGGTTTLSYFDIYCVSSTECAYVFFEDNDDGIMFVDCETDECATASDTVTEIVDIGTGKPSPVSIYCNSVTTCKVVAHDVDAGDLVFVNCADGANATADENCSGITPDVLDSDVGTTGQLVMTAVDCVSSESDCRVVYADRTDEDLTFLDCNDTDCDTPSTTTDIDISGGTIGSGMRSLGMSCPAANDCKILYYASASTGLHFVDCDNDACSSGSVVPLEDPISGNFPANIGAIYCPSTNDCKMVAYEGTSTSNPTVSMYDCDSTNCFPTSSDLADPWTGETEVEAVSLTYDSTNSDLYAHVIMDSSDQAYFKSTDATSINWGAEYSYNFTAGDLGQISATETAAGFAQIGISLRQGSNYEFSTLPENIWLITACSPIIVFVGKKIKRRNRKK